MNTKNYTQVLIDGKIYTLGGSEDEGYLQKTASYVNDKIAAVRKIPDFAKQSAEYQMAMIELNLADDYFKAQERADTMERLKDDMEKETYSLKHELVSTQMKLEAVLKDLEDRQRQLEELSRKLERQEAELRRAERVATAGRQENAAAQANQAQGQPSQPANCSSQPGQPSQPEGLSSQPGQPSQPENLNSQPAAAGNQPASGQAGGRLSDEELAKKALQAARKANSRKGHR